MANLAEIRLYIITNPSFNDVFSFDFVRKSDNYVIATVSMQAKTERTGPGEFTIGSDRFATAQRIRDAISVDYSDFFSVGASGDIVYITSSEFDRFFDDFSSDEWITSVIIPEQTLQIVSTSYQPPLSDSCDNVRVRITEVNDISYPALMTWQYNGDVYSKEVNNLSELITDDFPRISTGTRNVGIQSNDEVAFFPVALVRKYFITGIEKETVETATNITILFSDSGVGVFVNKQFSLDGITYQNTNQFFNLPDGEYTAYLRDSYGCVEQFEFEIIPFIYSAIYAVHNPLMFLVERAEEPYPESVELYLFVNNINKGSYKAIPYQTTESGQSYILYSDEIIRAFMPPFDDYFSPIDNLAPVQNMAAGIRIMDGDNIVSEFIAVNAARQIGGYGAQMIDLINNLENDYVLISGQPGYVYFYDNGFYREKMILTASETVTRAGKSKKVEVLPYCSGDVILKYLDRNGMYRFYKLSRNYEITVKPEKIGAVGSLYHSIASAQGIEKNVGYRSKRELKVIASNVPERHMLSLQDIYTSPRVYLYTGPLGLDNLQDWLLVTVEGDGKVKAAKRKFTNVELTIILPDEFNVTML